MKRMVHCYNESGELDHVKENMTESLARGYARSWCYRNGPGAKAAVYEMAGGRYAFAAYKTVEIDKIKQDYNPPVLPEK